MVSSGLLFSAACLQLYNKKNIQRKGDDDEKHKVASDTVKGRLTVQETADCSLSCTA